MPVDIASGMVRLALEDITLPGKVPLVWNRLYSSRLLAGAPSALGRGWTNAYFTALTKITGGYRFLTPEGDVEELADPDDLVERGGKLRRLATFQELFRRGPHYVVQRWAADGSEIVRYVFAKGAQQQAWPLAGIEDARGHALELAWDPQGRLSGIRQRLEQRVLIVGYDARGHIEHLVFKAADGSKQVLVRYEHDANGCLVAAYDAAEYADRYEYHADGRLAREIIKDGGIFTYRYDQQGRCVQTYGLDRYAQKRLSFFPAIGFTEVTDSYGGTYRYQYLPSGQIVKVIDPLGVERQTSYDEHGRVIAKQSGGAVTRFAYDPAGNRTLEVDPLGNEYHYRFNDHHQQVAFIDAAGQMTRRTYDHLNRIASSQDALGATWHYVHDADGNLVQLIDPNGESISIEHSASGATRRIIDAEGNATRYRFDALGRLLELIRCDGTAMVHAYDARGSLLSSRFADGSSCSFRYDAAGNVIESTGATGLTTQYRYGTCRRLLEVRNAAGHSRHYRWGTEPNRLEAVLNERGEEYRFLYDAVGRVSAEITFSGRRLDFQRDMAGNCVSARNGAGEEVLYEYDARGSLKSKTLPDGTSTTFEYDANGYLLAARNPAATLSYERDAVGRVLVEHQNAHWLKYRYDGAGRLRSIETSLGHAQQFSYRCGGILDAVAIKHYGIVSYDRNAVQRTSQRKFPGGMTLHHGYDEMQRLVRQEVALAEGAPEPSLQRRFSYGPDSTLQSVSDTLRGTSTFEYDPLERVLTSATAGHTPERFAYDVAGNVLAMHTASVDAELRYAPGNLLSTLAEVLYHYDANGRLIGKTLAPGRSWHFEWNGSDQLQRITDPDGQQWQYAYDALGRRIAKTGPDGRQCTYLWDRNTIIHQLDYDQSISTWIHDPTSLTPFAKISGDTLYAVVTDNTGAAKELVAMTGRVEWSARGNLWGHRRPDEVSDDTHELRFVGQWFDVESGLHYNRFRYYDPEVARYISPDPIRSLGGWNEYWYCRNPLNWIDPYGLVRIFRGMSKDKDGAPVVPTTENKANPANSLGIRTGEDGMSTNLDPAEIPAHRRPPGFGPGDDPKKNQKGSGMFTLDTDTLAEVGLRWDNDHDTHGILVPVEAGVSAEEHNRRIAATRDKWKEVTPEELEEERKKQSEGGGCGE